MASFQPVSAASHPLRQVLIDLAIITGVGLVLALIGPFNSFELPFARRLFYWVFLAWVGYACYRPIGALIARFGSRLDLPLPALWCVACLIATVPMTLVVALAAQPLGSLRDFSAESWLTSYGYVLAIGAPVTLLFYVLGQNRAEAAIANATDATPPPEVAPAYAQPRLLSRLSPGLGEEIIALEMEDHYLRVHTALGSELILLRMRDALGELEGIAGAQVHRSWWVARSAVQGTERVGRNLRLVLPRGIVVPVARNMASALKTAGWF